MKFRLWLSVRMGCSPSELGERLTAEEYHQLAVMFDAGDLQR